MGSLARRNQARLAWVACTAQPQTAITAQIDQSTTQDSSDLVQCDTCSQNCGGRHHLSLPTILHILPPDRPAYRKTAIPIAPTAKPPKPSDPARLTRVTASRQFCRLLATPSTRQQYFQHLPNTSHCLRRWVSLRPVSPSRCRHPCPPRLPDVRIASKTRP